MSPRDLLRRLLFLGLVDPGRSGQRGRDGRSADEPSGMSGVGGVEDDGSLDANLGGDLCPEGGRLKPFSVTTADAASNQTLEDGRVPFDSTVVHSHEYA